MGTKSDITFCINTHNNLNYLILAVDSIRKYAYYDDSPIQIYAENCTDGTDKWLSDNYRRYSIDFDISHTNTPVGLGGGINECVDRVKTKFVNIIHSDMVIAADQDYHLLRYYDDIDDSVRLVMSSFRVQPKIFPNDPWYRPGTVFLPPDEIGEYHHNFDEERWIEWADEFSGQNHISVRKAGGAGFFCRTEDFKWIGGNDKRFAPASWEDMDLFIRMQNEGYEFKMVSDSLVYHFSARGSHFPDDNFSGPSQRQIASEKKNVAEFMAKWGRLPEQDEQTFVKPIINPSVENRIPWGDWRK